MSLRQHVKIMRSNPAVAVKVLALLIANGRIGKAGVNARSLVDVEASTTSAPILQHSLVDRRVQVLLKKRWIASWQSAMMNAAGPNGVIGRAVTKPAEVGKSIAIAHFWQHLLTEKHVTELVTKSVIVPRTYARQIASSEIGMIGKRAASPAVQAQPLAYGRWSSKWHMVAILVDTGLRRTCVTKAPA